MHRRRKQNKGIRKHTTPTRRCSSAWITAEKFETGQGNDVHGAVVVAGATGGVGQLACQELMKQSQYRIVPHARSDASKQRVPAALQENTIIADLRYRQQIDGAIPDDVRAAIICVGTTAFPTARWRGGNPESNAESIIRLIGVLQHRAESNGLEAIPVTMLSSAGADDPAGPIALLNLFGAISWLKRAEMAIESTSRMSWSIVRPGRLIGGPLTSYDLNSAVAATDAGLDSLCLLPADAAVPQQTSRAHVARCMAASIFSENAQYRKVVVSSERADDSDKSDEQSSSLGPKQCTISDANDSFATIDALYARQHQ